MAFTSKTSAAGLLCLLLAFAALGARADAAVSRRVAATTLAFNPQPDPPGLTDEDFGFGRS